MESISKRKCGDCKEVIFPDPYFSCMLCVGINPYELCVPCHRRGKFIHKHPSINFLDHRHTLLKLLRSPTADAAKIQVKEEMNEVRTIAIAYYRASSPELQTLAYEFFKSMDTDGNGTVEIHEFLSFMREEGLVQMQNSSVFAELDTDGNGTLDFWEVLTLYYIIKSGRPLCVCCGKFSFGTYFSCVVCFSSTKPFSICCDCYFFTKCTHSHDGGSQFLDNFTLLELKRNLSLPQINQPTGSEMPSPLSANVPPKNKTKIAFQVFEAAIKIGNVATNVAGLVGCTIM